MNQHEPLTGLDNADGVAFLEAFRELSSIGSTSAGGVDRQAGTPEDGQMRRWFSAWLTEHGFRVIVDQIGNLFGILEWSGGAPTVLSGSHLDSQPLGGKFDGAYGVLASAHAAHRLDRLVREGRAVPAYNLAVVDWFNEEGSRFGPSMMGSSVFTGKLHLDDALATVGADGSTVEDALGQIGSLGTAFTPNVTAYAEIHVEQGRILDDSGITIGIVTETWAARKFEAIVHGEQSHTGSTIMSDRRDALAAAARLVVAVRELARTFQDAPLHTSVARLVVLPNSPVVVARQVTMNIDLRSPDPKVLDAAEARLREMIAQVEHEDRVDVALNATHAWDRQPYQQWGVDIAHKATRALDLRSQEMMTIAGHDSTNMKDIVPTVMLFVPSVDGIAHNEGEQTDDDDCIAGMNVLTEVLANLCGLSDLRPDPANAGAATSSNPNDAPPFA